MFSISEEMLWIHLTYRIPFLEHRSLCNCFCHHHFSWKLGICLWQILDKGIRVWPLNIWARTNQMTVNIVANEAYSNSSPVNMQDDVSLHCLPSCCLHLIYICSVHTHAASFLACKGKKKKPSWTFALYSIMTKTPLHDLHQVYHPQLSK